MNRLFFLSMTFILVLMFFTSTVAGDIIHNSSIVPTGKVTVFEEGKKIAEHTSEMPLPAGALLSCTGRCLIKMGNLALVGEDNSKFIIDSDKHNRYLSVQEGTVYFGLSVLPMPIVFSTPKGAVSAHRITLNVSSGINMLEGYIRVGETACEIGVIDGGALHIQTNEGWELLKPGHRFLLAQAEMSGAATAGATTAGATTAGGVFGTGLAAGTIVAITGAAVTGGVVVHTILDKIDDKDGSPFMP